MVERVYVALPREAKDGAEQMTRPPRNQSLVIVVSLQQKIAIRHLARAAKMNISQYLSSLISRKAWSEIDKRAIMIQTGAAPKPESGDEQ
jgi:predicted ATP-grasp superfamily ATP-dependent carboligase